MSDRVFFARGWGLLITTIMLLAAGCLSGSLTLLSMATLGGAVWCFLSVWIHAMFTTTKRRVPDPQSRQVYRAVLLHWRAVVAELGLVPGTAKDRSRPYPVILNHRLDATGPVFRVRIVAGQSAEDWERKAAKFGGNWRVGLPVTVSNVPGLPSHVEIRLLAHDILSEYRGK